MVNLKKVKIFFYYYLPVIIWLALIYYFSSIPNLKAGADSISEEVFLRKGAHLIEYFVLAFLIFRIFYSLKKIKLGPSCIYTLTLTLLGALSDEFHQSFVIGRSGNFQDVVFDFFGSFIFFQLVFLVKVRKKMFSQSIGIFMVLILLIGMQIKMIDDGRSIQFEVDEIIQMKEVDIKEVETPVVEEAKKLPEEILIKIPFTIQAPYAVWDEYHEEACEEASLIMIEYFLKGKSLSQEVAEKEIQEMIEFQIKNYGDYKDSTADELVKLAKDFYGIKNLEVIYDFSKADLKKYLSSGNPIIIPAAGRLLGNPYFTQPGPLYHNLVLVGYNEDEIITNDPGTKRGEGYVYDEDVLYEAIHDFTGEKENIEKGRKAMIIIK